VLGRPSRCGALRRSRDEPATKAKGLGVRASSERFSTIFLILTTTAALAACSHTSNSSSDTVVFGDPPLPASATRVGPAASNHELRLVLGLERDGAGLARRVRDIATEGSPYYHRRQSVAQSAAEFGATPETRATIRADLEARGLPVTESATGAFVSTQLTVAEAESLLDTTIGSYRIAGRGTFIAPDGPPSAPQTWQGAVREVLGLSTLPSLDDADTGDEEEPEAVAGTTTRSAPARASFTVIDAPGVATASGTPAGCAEALAQSGTTPNQLITAYGIEALHAQGFTGQGMRMALVEDGGFTPSDIPTFASCYGIANAATPTFIPTGGLTAQLPVNGEVTLDIEVALSIAPQLAGLYVFESNYDSLADYLELYGAPLDPANTGGVQIDVLSSSLGACEESLTASYVDLMEHLFATAAAANISVFASAGDSGSSTCYHHDKTTESLSASYPATSAYVTAVGGTNLALDTSNAIAGSSVWNDLPWNGKDAAGGGGPSVFIAAPAWQRGTGTGDAMRTTPDVAFYADPAPGYTIFNSSEGGWYDDGGTSAATPFFAASTALLHQVMLAHQGAAPVVAYEWISGIAASNANDVFYDIVLGDNDLFDVGCCTAGPGYDQASGWGSLNIAAVSAVLNASPQYQIRP
jgi:kumamolisin